MNNAHESQDYKIGCCLYKSAFIAAAYLSQMFWLETLQMERCLCPGQRFSIFQSLKVSELEILY